jgi:cysteine-rich repeat protein
MRKTTPSVAFALAMGIAVLGPSASCSSTGSSGPSEDAGTDLTSALTTGMCGDGVLNIGEQCDLGPRNGISADGGQSGCDKHCNLYCIPDTLDGNAICDDHNPCNGTETCAGPHNDAGVPPNTCAPGTPLPDGMPCGMNGLCKSGTCQSSQCGNGVVEAPEECDLGTGNGTGPDGGSSGCGTDCRWVCVATDSTRNCASTNPCVAQGTCQNNHVCTPGQNMTDGTSCGTNEVCKNGKCQSAQCGDGIVESPEQCDFGTGNGLGTGCESNCTFSCSLSPNDCVTADSCAGLYACTTVMLGTQTGQKCGLGPPAAAGTSCSGGKGTCTGPDAGKSYCALSTCGNGTVDADEDCDWGSMNGPGVGCELDCKFSCSTNHLASNACPGLDPCSATPQVCQTAPGPGSNAGQKCGAAPVLSMCASCGGGAVCVNSACKTSSCGDHCVVAPEQCDPPDGVTCDPNCQKIVCGDGVVAGKEQCDDGNTTNLDGCDSYCNFEQLHRLTQLKYSPTTDAFCTNNALGSQVITTAGLSVIQANTDQDITSGATNVIYKFFGMSGQQADLTGTSGNVVLGSLAGNPEMVVDGGAYNGNADLDWWYSVDPTTVDSNNNPLFTLNGTYTNKLLSAGPGNMSLKVNLSGSSAALSMWNAKIKVTVGASNAPTISSTGASPGHVASEHVLSTLVSFATGGVGGSGPTGELCGNITTQSLSTVLTPPILTIGASTACDENYTSTSHLLDVLVHGCSLSGQGVMNASQPDQQLSTVTFPSGTVPPYKLSASSSSTHAVDTCKDSSATPKTVPLSTCLTGLAFSSAFTFQTDRVIIKP